MNYVDEKNKAQLIMMSSNKTTSTTKEKRKKAPHVERRGTNKGMVII
jgi:hypothetical protein